MLQTPVQRGKHHGIVGNGAISHAAWCLFEDLKKSSRLMTEKDWQMVHVDPKVLKEQEVSEMLGKHPVQYYYVCPTCKAQGRQGYL